jgi:NRAMP (natural resistance-associated macrophage protein)-like metal ion transporter
VKKFLQLALGILTAIGGFFDIGNLVTAAQAGAAFRFQLLWALAFGTVIVIFLVEMSGRLAAVTSRTLPEAIRERFGVRVVVPPLIVLLLLHLLTLAAEIGGVSLALQLLTGIRFQIWALPVGILTWLFLWRSSFDAVEYSTASLGMITLCFVVGAIVLHPSRGEVLAGLLPSLPKAEPAKYWLYAVSLLGALIAPYLFYFYSSGAVEDKWDDSYLWINRAVSVTGMVFGAVISGALLIVAGIVLQPKGIAADSINQIAFVLTEPFPFWGFALFVASLGIACLGASLEVALSFAYTTSQTFGWEWGQNLTPAKHARFSLTYTGAIVIASGLIALGLDPVKLTIYTMALNAAALPVVAGPFLLLMNDRHLLGKHANGPISNSAIVVIVATALVLFIVSVPLVFLGS